MLVTSNSLRTTLSSFRNSEDPNSVKVFGPTLISFRAKLVITSGSVRPRRNCVQVGIKTLRK
uniref:Uncharacterized protein n=1 Tax=uncultured marine virus TaxID=186617 RepID=A0A0F7L818_9VIRU|nr:hypothetical protein ALOHA_HF400048F7ctg1g15 [uncultured marine virus]